MCEYFENLFILTNESPDTEIITMEIIVPIVTTVKMVATNKTESIFPLAAGYIINGIKGSHGPKTKIIKRLQTTVFEFFDICGCTWSFE